MIAAPVRQTARLKPKKPSVPGASGYNRAMSWILAVETSTEWCSVALGRAVAGAGIECLVRHEHTGARSSARVLPAAGELLSEAGIALANCAAIAFGAGPGSFTGLRTACGVAQGLAFGAGLPVVPVNTLLACAERVRAAEPALPADTSVLVALDARMDEAYAGAFGWDAAAQEWVERTPMLVSAPETVQLPGGEFWLAGNAATVFGERLAGLARAQRVLPEAMPHAQPMIAIALRALARGEAIDADRAMPIYLRDKVAQTIAEREAAAAARAAATAGSAS